MSMSFPAGSRPARCRTRCISCFRQCQARRTLSKGIIWLLYIRSPAEAGLLHAEFCAGAGMIRRYCRLKGEDTQVASGLITNILRGGHLRAVLLLQTG
jgi:hypothetical protein